MNILLMLIPLSLMLLGVAGFLAYAIYAWGA